MTDKMCYKLVLTRGMNFPDLRRCRNKAVVKRDGKGYCRCHDPVVVAEKEKAKDKKRLAEMERKHKIYVFLKYGKQKRAKS